jgi:hypothetical protein
VNRLVREHRGDVERFLRAAEALRDAQLAGHGSMAEATRRERDELQRLIRVGGELVRQSLLAAAVDDDAARRLLEARLERELEPSGFGTLIAHARPAAAGPGPGKQPVSATPDEARSAPTTHPEPAAQKRVRPDDTIARARLENALAALESAEAEEQHARRRLQDAKKAVEQAQAAVESARRDLDRLHGL